MVAQQQLSERVVDYKRRHTPVLKMALPVLVGNIVVHVNRIRLRLVADKNALEVVPVEQAPVRATKHLSVNQMVRMKHAYNQELAVTLAVVNVVLVHVGLPLVFGGHGHLVRQPAVPAHGVEKALVE